MIFYAKSYRFLIACKKAYFDGETPVNDNGEFNKKCIDIISIAKKYFAKNKYEEFSGFFQEGQYFIQLWAAHLIIEYGTPDADLKIRSLDIIKDYTSSPLSPGVAENEERWLKKYLEKLK